MVEQSLRILFLVYISCLKEGFSFMGFHLLNVGLCYRWSLLKSFPVQVTSSLFHTFPSGIFRVSCLILRPLIHLQLNKKERSMCILPHAAIMFGQHPV